MLERIINSKFIRTAIISNSILLNAIGCSSDDSHLSKDVYFASPQYDSLFNSSIDSSKSNKSDVETYDICTKKTYFPDKDGDGYGVKEGNKSACEKPEGNYVTTLPFDCNDNNKEIYPTAKEICNGVDDNCNGQTDEGIASEYCKTACGEGQIVCKDGKMQECSTQSLVESCGGVSPLEVECETNTPCRGTKIQECVCGKWQDKSDCIGAKFVANGSYPSVEKSKLVYLDNNTNLVFHNLNKSEKKTLATFPPNLNYDAITLKISSGNILYSRSNSKLKGIIKVFNSQGNILFQTEEYNLGCFDISGNKLVCRNGDDITVIDIGTNYKNKIISNPCNTGSITVYNNTLIKNNIVVVPNGKCANEIHVYDLNVGGMVSDSPFIGEWPLLSNEKVLYGSASLGEVGPENKFGNLYLFDIVSGKKENLSPQMGNEFKFNSLGSHVADFEGDTLVYPVYLKTNEGKNTYPLYVANLKTKKFQKITEPSPYDNHFVSLSNGRVVFTQKKGIYSCNLKGEWGIFAAEAEEVTP